MTTPVRLVLADDTDPLRMLLRRVFDDDARFEVVAEAADGVEALDRVREYTPDLLLLDLSMPRMDGLEVLDRLRALDLPTKVIVLSGHAADAAAEASLERGALAYIEKGVRPLALLDAIVEVLDAAASDDFEPTTLRSDTPHSGTQDPDATDSAQTAGDPEPASADGRREPPEEEPPLESLVSQLVHDLRSPVGLAVGYVDLLRRQELGPEPTMLLDRVNMALAHLDELVTTLGSYARVGRLDLTPQPLAISHVVDVARSRLSERHDDLDRVSVEDPGLTVRADPDALAEVMAQLLDNALRYSAEPVIVRVSSNDGTVVVEVADRGPGITEDDADALFMPFKRGLAARGNWGTGLGLALSARLVRAMDGRIWAVPRNPGGTVVAVELPAVR